MTRASISQGGRATKEVNQSEISPEIGVNMGGDGTLGCDYVWR